jgi:hypothetical protein
MGRKLLFVVGLFGGAHKALVTPDSRGILYARLILSLVVKFSSIGQCTASRTPQNKKNQEHRIPALCSFEAACR